MTKEKTKKVEEEKKKEKKEDETPVTTGIPKEEKLKEASQPKQKKKKTTNNGSLNMKIKSHILQTAIGAIRVFNEESLFQIKPQGITVEQVDVAHAAMVHLDLSSKACEEYKANSLDVGVMLEKLSDLLKLSNADDIVSLEYDGNGGTNCLFVSFGNLRRRIGCLDVDSMDKPKIPEIEAKITAELEAKHLTQAIKAAALVADYFAFIATKDILEVFTENDTDNVHVKFNKEDELKAFDAPGGARSLYAIDYATACLKSAKSDTLIKLGFNIDSPATIAYDFADGNGKLQYLIAPRIESKE